MQTMRHAALIVLLLIALTLGAGTGWYWWTAWRFQQSTDDAYIQSDITVISPKVEGYIKEVRVEENQEVAAGQVLIVVDDRDFAARTAQAEAAERPRQKSATPRATCPARLHHEIHSLLAEGASRHG